MLTVITAGQLFTPGDSIALPAIFVEDGIITRITTQTDTPLPANAHHLNYPGSTIVPAYLDVHIHGAAGHDVMEGTPDALNTIGSFLAGTGVGHYLPTTVTAPVDATLHALDGIASAIESVGQASAEHAGARPVGIHLEGPFVSHAKRGVHPVASILEPSVAVFDSFWQASRGHILLMTIAPELPNALEVIAHAVSRGVRVSLGHSNATREEALAGIEAGATSATHTFNAMRALDHRDPGILGVVLDRDDLYAELICDGIHVEPELVRLWLKAKGPARAMLVTDAMSATGMPDGTYMLGDIAVQVADGHATSDGVLAGSVLTMDQAVRRLTAFTSADLQTATRLASSNPASMLGLDLGNITEGMPASINILSRSGLIQSTVLGTSQR